MAARSEKEQGGTKGNQDWEWQRVRRKKSMQPNVMHGSSKVGYGGKSGVFNSKNPNPRSVFQNLKEVLNSFFFTNFPSSISVNDLWKRFGEWGTVVDVFVPKRLSKLGKTFGFVRYVRVSDNLRSMWFGNYHLFADVVKYDRKNMNGKLESNPPGNPKPSRSVEQEGQFSYVDAVKGSKGATKENQPIHLTIPETIPSGCILLGRLEDPKAIPYFNRSAALEGFENLNVSYVGGRWIKLVFANMEVKDRFMGCGSLTSKFSQIRPFDPLFVPDERMVWLEVSGLLIGACQVDILRQVVSKWGMWQFSSDDVSDPLAIGRVCISTTQQELLWDCVEVYIRDLSFKVWIKEFTTWAPEILGMEETEYEQSSADEKDNLSHDQNLEAEEDESVEGEVSRIQPGSLPFLGSRRQSLKSNSTDDIFSLKKLIEVTVGKKHEAVEVNDHSGNNEPFLVKETSASKVVIPSESTSDPYQAPGFERVRHRVPAQHFGGNMASCSRGDSNRVEEIIQSVEIGKLMGFNIKDSVDQIEMVLNGNETHMVFK